MKFSVSEISDIIELAWDDQTDFSHITKLYNIDEGEVKKIMKKYVKNISFLYINRIMLKFQMEEYYEE